MKNCDDLKECFQEPNVNLTERVISLAAGSLLLYSLLSKRGRLLKGLAGSLLMFRGATGYCPAYEAFGKGEETIEKNFIHINTSVTVDKPRQEVYAFWRQLENLPKFMTHLESVKVNDDDTSEWKARIPGDLGSIGWKSEMIRDKPNEHISWRSLPDSDIDTTGFVDFRDTVNLGTVIHVVISYHPPAGKAGEKIGKLLNPVFEKLVTDDIKNFKSFIENTG